MIEIDDIKKAVEEKLPLFQNGTEISYDACEYFLTLPPKETDILFSALPMKKGQNRSGLFIMCQCPKCKKNFAFETTKTGIKNSRKKGMVYLAHQSSSISFEIKRALDNYVHIIKPDNDLREIPQICDDCLLDFFIQQKSEYDGFFNNPLKWVNTHSKDIDSWAWKYVSRLFTYPPDYNNHPAGWKYCGLRMSTHDTHRLRDVIDADFEKWKNHKEKIRPGMNVSSVHTGLKEVFGDKLYSSSSTLAKKKTIKLVEDTIEGLLKETSIQSVLGHIVKEGTSILANIEKLSSSTHILTFGKYKGYTVHDVIAIDPEYICWALDTIKGFALDENEWAHYMGKPWKTENVEDKVNVPSGTEDESSYIENDEENNESQGTEHT